MSVNFQAGYVLTRNSTPEQIAEARRAVEAPAPGYAVNLKGGYLVDWDGVLDDADQERGSLIEHAPSADAAEPEARSIVTSGDFMPVGRQSQ